MTILFYLAAFIVALGPLIVAHELGHYWVARWCGVKVLRFSVGFGKPLKTWVRGTDRTEWVLAVVPLGGYVKMLDEREGTVAPDELPRAFNRQNVWKRIAIVIAGPLANLLMAILLYWVLFMHGVPGIRPVVDAPTQASAAAMAGFQKGDVILSVAGESTPTWQEARWELLKQAVPKNTIEVQVSADDGSKIIRKLDMSGLTANDLDGDFIRVLGLFRLQPRGAPEITSVAAGSAAERAGLLVGDEIVAINNVRIESADQATRIIRDHAEKAIVVELRRGNNAMPSIQVTPDRVSDTSGRSIGRIGAMLQPPRGAFDKYRVNLSYGPVDSLGKAIAKTWDTSIFSLRMLGKMVVGEVSLKNLSGPITIADYAGQSAKLGWIPYITFLALISISLGVLNLLPIPLLDGGHLMYYIAEIFKGSPVSENAMEIGQRIGVGLLLLMMTFAIFNDVNRLING
ncbi:MAG: RIP metalloprotease RseP [Burkholderiales bacterium]